MKVWYLIEILKNYPKDASVVALWDAGWSNLDKHSLESDDNGNEVVQFDVEEYGTYEDGEPGANEGQD
jgi:hypothetical protein